MDHPDEADHGDDREGQKEEGGDSRREEEDPVGIFRSVRALDAARRPAAGRNGGDPAHMAVHVEGLHFQEHDRRGNGDDMDPDVDVLHDPLVLGRVEVALHDYHPRVDAQEHVVEGNGRGNLKQESLYRARKMRAIGAEDV
mmetsp:Transcript_23328/g.55169  ORF Transcript_23328/g.55169 Transcript_23328/m.55169 type:complete len:141 (-) Transcript_23328:657-1079(-)